MSRAARPPPPHLHKALQAQGGRVGSSHRQADVLRWCRARRDSGRRGAEACMHAGRQRDLRPGVHSSSSSSSSGRQQACALPIRTSTSGAASPKLLVVPPVSRRAKGLRPGSPRGSSPTLEPELSAGSRPSCACAPASPVPGVRREGRPSRAARAVGEVAVGEGGGSLSPSMDREVASWGSTHAGRPCGRQEQQGKG